jgi:competence protein ComEC
LGEDRVTFTLRADQLPGALHVTWFSCPPMISRVQYGDRLALAGSVRLPEAFSGFDYPAYLANRGIFATMIVDGDESVCHKGVAGSPTLRLGDRVRQSLLRVLQDALGPREVGLAQGLLLGDRTALSDDVEDAFRRTGLMHVLAVSGLHLGIILAGAWFALRRAGVRAAVAYPVVGLLVLLVLWIVGPRVSLVRASLLFAFLGLGSVLADLGLILRRSVDPLNGLAAAALVILAMRPTELFEAGFQLSFAATAGILIVVSSGFRGRWQPWIRCVSEKSGRLAPLVRYALTLIAISAAAQASVAPVVAWHFGTFHPLQLGLNLIVVPIVTLALWIGLPGILLLASTGVGVCVAPFGWVLRALSWIVEVTARIPVVECAVSRWFGLWSAALVAFLLLAARYASDESS